MQTQPPAGAALAQEIANAYALVDRRAFAEAEAACRRVLAATNNTSPQAWTALGVVLREQGRTAESKAAYERAIAIAPRNVHAHHNLGALLSQLDLAEESLAALDRAASLGLNAPELHINRGRALAQLYQFEESERAYTKAVALDPRNVDAQSMLAQLRHMRGDPAFARDFAAAIRANPGHLPLQFTYSELLHRAGDLGGAEAVLRDLLKSSNMAPAVRSALANLLHETGRLAEAEQEALQAALGRPGDPTLIGNFVQIELALGKPDACLPLIRTERQRRPREPRWVTYEAMATRLLGDPLYQRLYDYARFVRAYDVQPPAGWSSMIELNAAVVAALRSRHRLATHPLDQSLRNGTQTMRNLLTDRDPVIQALIGAFAAPIADYCAAVGSDPGHPLTARNSGAFALHGCWSVELHRNGFHVNHFHPEGWLSSAYYVSVPQEVEDAQARSGWLKFGEPRLPVAGLGADHFVQPRAGRLVLFPSYMWHGTNAIRGEERRLTVAFDVVPGA
jgi:tetratricopeptide (TPR) repeat protein